MLGYCVDAKGKQQTWAAASQHTLKNGSTAADLSEELFKQAGLKADYDPNGSWGWVLNSITSPFDADCTLAYDHATGAYWQLFINGVAASVGAGKYTLEAGDSVVWCYSKYGDAAPTDQLSVSCTVIGQDASGAQQTWAQLRLRWWKRVQLLPIFPSRSLSRPALAPTFKPVRMVGSSIR